MKNKKINMSDILKDGAILNVHKIYATKDVNRLIESSRKEQQRIIDQHNLPFKNLVITI